jgi:uncharacterized protein
MKEKSREFQVFVKPVGAVCNLRCSYCYYLEKKALFPDEHNFLMEDDTLEKYIFQNIEASDDELISFSWHGGEPLLAGIDFYRKALGYQSLHKPEGKTIINGIQTNGTLIDEEWAKFLSENNFLVGISIDGDSGLHDLFRKKKNGEGTWHNVVNGFHNLLKWGIIPEILCVVNSENVKYPLEIYNFFKQTGAKFMTFLPLVERDVNTPIGVSEKSVPPEEFGYFLSSIFDEWLEKDVGEIKVQIFEEAARCAFNQDHTLCIFRVNCGGVPVVEHNGDFFSCDHYVSSDHLIGNIRETSLADLLDSERQIAFGMAKSLTLPGYCRQCEVRQMCNGECPKNRFAITPDGEAGLNYLCRGYRYFFNHCRPFVEAVRQAFEENQKV